MCGVWRCSLRDFSGTDLTGPDVVPGVVRYVPPSLTSLTQNVVCVEKRKEKKRRCLGPGGMEMERECVEPCALMF